ncbi:MAG TPA: hypothetical protein VGC13_04400 [Longimicrobium sp.]|jgi:RecA/RadA recombinase|uniref:hypothetical protein n=1 Tax=Longimicrobium sp. TaxID=2029185 RepID=UPI002EDAB13D
MRHGDGLDSYRQDASFLLKRLRSDDPEISRKAAEAFAKLPWMDPPTVEQALSIRDRIQRKHALDAVAIGEGCGSWEKLVRTRGARPAP